MHQFSLRHLFLLTSFFCLCFGAYAYGRNPLMFALPNYAVIAGVMVYYVRSNEAEEMRIKRLGWMTLLNLLLCCLGLILAVMYDGKPTGSAYRAYFIGVSFGAACMCFQSVLLGTTASRGVVVAIAMAYLFLNILMTGAMLISSTPVSTIR